MLELIKLHDCIGFSRPTWFREAATAARRATTRPTPPTSPPTSVAFVKEESGYDHADEHDIHQFAPPTKTWKNTLNGKLRDM